MASWDDAKRKLDLLRELNRALAGADAWTADYLEDPHTPSELEAHERLAKLGDTYPLAQSELEALERDLGVRLPDDFRDFLLEVGWGPGPYDGLYSPDQILAEARMWDHWFEDDGRGNRVLPEPYVETNTGWPLPDRPFPIGRTEAERIPQGWRWQSAVETLYPTPGCVLIGYQGGRYYDAIVTAGELTGSVWDLLRDVDSAAGIFRGTWVPARFVGENPRREPQHLPLVPSFRQWYSGWLDASLEDLASIEPEAIDKRSRVEAILREYGVARRRRRASPIRGLKAIWTWIRGPGSRLS